MLKIIRKWLLKEIIKENSAQWQAIWDLRSVLLTCKELGFDIKIKEIDIKNKRFFNSLEEKEVGTRQYAGFSIKKEDKIKNCVSENILKLTGKTPEEVSKIWNDIERHSPERKVINL